MLETPSQLSDRFETGQMDRAEYQAHMALHARELINEIEEDHQNPLAAWVESQLAKKSLRKLLKKHSPHQIREILIALSENPQSKDFPMAAYLWNASHPDLPLHTFFRIRRQPVFQILSIHSVNDQVQLRLKIGEARDLVRLTLVRDARWQLHLASPA